MQELAPRSHRQSKRKLLHEAEGFAQLLTVGGFRNNDTVQSPNGIELEFLGQVSEINDLADGHLVPEVG